jgi:hypothetical protein
MQGGWLPGKWRLVCGGLIVLTLASVLLYRRNCCREHSAILVESAVSIASDGAGFLEGPPKELLPGLYYLGDFRGGATYGFFASSRFFLVATPCGPGLVDFVNTGLQKLGLKPVAPAVLLLTSCGQEDTAGLKEFVDSSHAQVVAARSGLQKLREACPPGTIVLSPAEFSRQGWVELWPMPLLVPGAAPIIYQVLWGNKVVLFSGRIPVPANQHALRTLLGELKTPADVSEYLDSLERMSHLRADLWLPAFPARGKSANLYDKDWQATIASNRRLFKPDDEKG